MLVALTCRGPSFTQLILRAAHCTRALPLGRQITYSLSNLQEDVRGIAQLSDAALEHIRKPAKSGTLLAYYSDHLELPLGPKHRFPDTKYAKNREQLMADPELQGLIEYREAPAASIQELQHVHTPEYVARVHSGELTQKEVRGIGFPWSPKLVLRSNCSCGGTLAAMRSLLEWNLGIACNLAGGTHHSFRHIGEGYCVWNDIAVSAMAAIDEYGLQRILVIGVSRAAHLILDAPSADLDVHQGNGTSDIFHQDERVTTFDMHGAKNWPWSTRRTSTYDVALPDDCADDEYLGQLEHWLPLLFERHQPQLVFFQAGVDALKQDKFGRLGMSREGLQQRNLMVYRSCRKEAVPLVVSMGGGYCSPQELQLTVDAHSDVYRLAALHLAGKVSTYHMDLKAHFQTF